ncbi:MAG: DUF2752 domain-containing protein [Clostridiaceae bacterium]|nr:DUF2752 domain-containing protein [Clostridiaceae bacterium]
MITINSLRKLGKYFNKWLTFFSKPFIRFIMLILTSIIIFTACSLVYKIDPSTTPITPPCSLRYFTGLYCPGCGMTRALHAALHLRFAEAFSYNLLWPLIIIFISASFYIWFFFLISGKNPFTPFNNFFKKHSSAPYIVLILLFSFWILRNIPVYPFTLLAP